MSILKQAQLYIVAIVVIALSATLFFVRPNKGGETREDMKGFLVELTPSKSLLISLPDADDYEEAEVGYRWIRPSGTVWNRFIYFATQDEMEDYLDMGEAEYVVERSGWFYGEDLKITVHGHEASHIYAYTNNGPMDAEITSDFLEDSSEITDRYCLFDLSLVDEDLNGVLVLSGRRTPGTNLDFCASLNDEEYFELASVEI